MEMNDLEKLKHLIDHWIEHNNAHVKTYSEWALKAESLGEKGLSGVLMKIAGESRKLEGLFQEALISLKK
jgi:hypothetical protein